MTDEDYMREALSLAKEAFSMGEVPVGAVAVWDGKIVGRGMNRRETDKNALRHAEIAAIDEACKNLGGWRLWKCDLYVTLEPCPMCAGAIINSRIKKVYIGAKDLKTGACGSKLNLLQDYDFETSVESELGILEEECQSMLKDFFKELRKIKMGDK